MTWPTSWPPSTRRQKPTSRRRRAVLGVLGAAVLGAALFAFGAFPQDRVRALVEEGLRRATGPLSGLAYLRVTPWALRGEARGLVLWGDGYRAEVDEVRFALLPSSLLRGKLAFRFLEIRHPVVVLTGATQPSSGPPSAPSLPATVERLLLTEGHLVIDTPALTAPVVVPSFTVSGSVGSGILTIDAPAATWQRESPVALGPLSARLEVTEPLAVRVEKLEIALQGSWIRGMGSVGPLAAPDLDLDVEAEVDARDAALVGLEGAHGRLKLNGSVTGTLPRLRAELRAVSEGLVAAGARVDRVEATLTHEAPASTRVHVDATLQGGHVRAEGRLVGEELWARIEASKLPLERLGAGSLAATTGTLSGEIEAQGRRDGVVPWTAQFVASGIRDPLGGTGRVEASASGSFRPARAEGEGQWRIALDRAAPRALEQPGVGALHLAASGTLSAGASLRVEGRTSGQAEFRGPGAPGRGLPIRGTFVLVGRDLSADLDALEGDSLRLALRVQAGRVERLEARAREVDLQPFLGSGGGRLSLDANLSGEWAALSGEASLRLDELRVQEALLGDVAGRLSLQEGSGRLELTAPALGATADAVLRPGADGGARGTLRLSNLEVERVAPLLPEPLRTRPITGQLSAQVEFDLPFSGVRGARLVGSISRMEASQGDWALEASTRRLVFEAGTISLEDAIAQVNGVQARLSGRIGLEGRPSDVALQLDADLARLPAPAPWRLDGRAVLEARLRGSLERPLLDGGMELTGVRVRRGEQADPLLEMSTGRLSLEDNRLVWTDLQASLAGGSLTSEGSVPLDAVAGAARRPGVLARARVLWRDVAAGQLLGAAVPAGAPLEAALSGELTLEGEGVEPLEWNGQLTLEPVEGKAAGLDLRLEAVRLTLQRGALSLPQLRLQAAGQTVEGSGRADLRRGELEATLRGQLDLRALAPLAEPAASVQGDMELDLHIGGSLREPRPEGSVVLRGVSVRAPAFPHALTEVEGRITLASGNLRLDGFKARLGGGAIEASGKARMAGVTLSDIDVAATGRDLALRYPLDFKSRVGADLRLGGETGALRLSGQVRVERGLYDSDIFLEDAVLRGETEGSAVAEPSPFLRSVALDLEVEARDRIVVRNNLAQLTLRGTARVRGDLETPAPYGRFELGDGGTVFLQTRRFTVHRGTLSFQGTLDPEINVRAESVIRQVGDEDVAVTVSATGPLSKPSLSLSSDPSYSEREIASLIATGRRGLALDSSAWVAGEQLASLLAGRLTRNLARGIMDLGLDEVDLQPELLAREADPGARFTFGKHLTPRAKLVYSVGLNDPEATYFLGEYRVRVGAEATARVQRDDLGEYTYGLGQRFRFGGPERRRRGSRTDLRTEIERLDFVGHLGLPEAELRETARVAPGDEITPWALQEDAERLETKLVSAGHIEALVSARAEDKVARFEVEAGAQYRALVRGLPDPPDLEPLLREARSEGEAVSRARERLFETAETRGFPHARVESRVEGEDDQRTLVFDVDPGRHVARTEALFPGAKAVSPKRLAEVSGGVAAILRDPEATRRGMRQEYRRAHYLTAEVGEPEIRESPDGTRLSVSLPVREGPRALVASVRFDGATLAEGDLVPLARLELGSPFDTASLGPALERIRAFYLEKGFAAIRVSPRLVPSGPDYDVVFDVAEGEARTVGSIVVSGQRRTRESVIRSRIDFRSGQPLDPRRLVVAERRILDLNVFSRVSVTASDDEPATVSVEVVERGPYTVAYDVRYNDLDRLTAVLDLEVGNLGGRGLALGGRYRQGGDLRETRASLSLPVLGRTRGFLATVFQQEEDFLLAREIGAGPSPGAPYRDTERQQGFELQQAAKLGNKWDALYGYRFRRVSSLATGFDQDVSSFGVALLRETRDNPLDARRGRFWSLSFDLAPKQLGSDFAFFRTYGQAFFIRSLGPSWTWAQAYRLGLANGLREKQGEQVQILGRATELFRAGGASSLRGFATDSVGPRSLVTGFSRGGEAVVVLSQEIRYHHPSGLGAAAFYDVGNVYAQIGDIDFHFRHSVGLGVRYASPIGLVRVDLGFPLGRRPGERSYQWFFTLGQAF